MATESAGCVRAWRPRTGFRWFGAGPALLAAVLGMAFSGPSAGATIARGPWTPIFKGIEHAVGTNTPGGGLPNHHVVHLLRVDLTDPDIRLFSSPRLDNYSAGSRETGGYTVSDFLVKHDLQVAINGGLFDPQEYYLPAGTPMDISGFSVCEGVVVSPQSSPSESASVIFDAANVPTVIPTNWPAISATGVYTAVSGSYPVLVNGVNVGYTYSRLGGFIHQTNPRTLFGVSQDKRYLFLLTIDGRQSGYSDGALDYESGAWLLEVGAWDGVNMDGGGSTTLVIEDSTGQPVRLNKSSAVADSGRERTVGSHFGIYAKPVVGFINDVAASPDDTTATISWTTRSPATSQVRYGTTPALGSATDPAEALVTQHVVALAGLSPGTTYYFSAVSSDGGTEYASAPQVFVTTNYVTTTMLYDVQQPWKYSVADLDGVAWTAPGFDDGAWSGPGAGLLWVDSRGGPRSGIEPANTPLPADPRNGGFPYSTYYFRTRFVLGGDLTGVTLTVTNWLDDGAVFYLNGAEVYRLRMEDAPAPIANGDLAVSFGCSGDATCPDVFTLAGDAVRPLVAGENVFAVEVHNYNARSPDITFGQSLAISRPIVRRPTLSIERGAGGAVVNWAGTGFVLQVAEDAAGPWTDVSGPVIQGPYTVGGGAGAKYYRLRK